MANDRENDVNEELVDLLLGKIEADTFPSTTMMDLVEEILEPDRVDDYARILMAKVARDTYPSMSLLDRLRSLA